MLPAPEVVSIFTLLSVPAPFSVPPPSALLVTPGPSFTISPIAIAEALRRPGLAPRAERSRAVHGVGDDLADRRGATGHPRRGRGGAGKRGSGDARSSGRAHVASSPIGSMMMSTPPLVAIPSIKHGRFIPAQQTLDPLRMGPHLAPAIQHAVLPYVHVGVASLFGRARGFEPTVLLSTRLGPLRPILNLGMPVVDLERWRYGLAGATALAWELPRRVSAFAEVGGVLYESVPRGYQKKSLVPSAGLRGHF
jgi:hypothetical protein